MVPPQTEPNDTLTRSNVTDEGCGVWKVKPSAVGHEPFPVGTSLHLRKNTTV